MVPDPVLQEIEAAVGGLFRLIEAPPADSQTRLRTLALSLDRLALAYHAIGDIEPASEITRSSSRDRSSLNRHVGRLFPEFGLYSSIEPAAARLVAFDNVVTGDAVSDLEEIAGDLSNVAGLLNQGDTQNALWEFKFMYERHWGRHLRDLQGYVHHLIHESTTVAR